MKAPFTFLHLFEMKSMSRDASCPVLDLFPMAFICMSASSKRHSYSTHTSAPYDGLAGQTQQASVLQGLQLDLSAVIMGWVHSVLGCPVLPVQGMSSLSNVS